MKSFEQCMHVRWLETGVTTAQHILGIHILQTNLEKSGVLGKGWIWEVLLPVPLWACATDSTSRRLCQPTVSPSMAVLYGAGQRFWNTGSIKRITLILWKCTCDILGHSQYKSTINTIDFQNTCFEFAQVWPFVLGSYQPRVCYLYELLHILGTSYREIIQHMLICAWFPLPV